MKISVHLVYFVIVSLFIVEGTRAQAPMIEWQNTIGGSGNESLFSIDQTTDGGYILGGYSNSNIGGDKTENGQGNYDLWIVKIDELGAIQWQNTIGGSSNDQTKSISQTTDGGFIVGGASSSPANGDKTENSHGSYDYWVIKLDASGVIQWQNTIGGSGTDWFNAIQQTTDDGYIMSGYSNSPISGDKTESSQGGRDFWVVKLNSTGSIQWQNTVGGSGNEWDCSVAQTADGGYILSGGSESGISGDKTEDTEGFRDYWVIKLDVFGVIQWQNTIGGNNNDLLSSIVAQTADGGYIMGGSSYSPISGDKTEDSQGDCDFWVVKLDGSGVIQWQNSIGGIGFEVLYSIKQTADGGYVLGGESDSGVSGDKMENSQGGTDFWVMKLDVNGAIEWQKTIGGGNYEPLRSVQQTADGGFILGGHSNSNTSGDKAEDSNGGLDYWVVKLGPWNVLPISLLDLAADVTEDHTVMLEWKTGSELNNDFFTIDRTYNGSDFEFVGTVDGAGNSNSMISYSLEDPEPYYGVSYYRLAQTDYDGSTEYSDLVAVEILNVFGELSVYPNPVNEEATVSFFSENAQGEAVLSILDAAGRSLHNELLMTNEGVNKVVLSTEFLTSGLYLATLKYGHEFVSVRMIKR